MTKNFTNIKPLNPHRTVIEQISKCFLICTAKRFSMFADYTPEEVTFPQHPLFKIFFFDVGHFLKFLLNLLQYCFCFMFCFVFGHKAGGISAPQSGIKPASQALEGEVSTAGPPGKPLWHPPGAEDSHPWPTPRGRTPLCQFLPSPTPDCPLSPRSFPPFPKTCSATSNHYCFFWRGGEMQFGRFRAPTTD